MKIAYLSTFYPFRGGIAQFNAALFREFEKQGHDVRAFNFSVQYPDFLFPGDTQFVKEGDNTDKINSQRILNTVNPLTYLSTANKIKKFKPDIVVTKFWLPFFGPALGTVLRSTKKYATNINIVDNAIPHEKRIGDRPFSKYFFNQNHKFITMSSKVSDDLKTLVKDPSTTFHPHPLYDHFPAKIDKSEARKKLGINENKKVLLFFGFIRDYKGLDVLIESMKNLNDEYQLVIAGEIYGDFEKYDKLINECGVSDKIQKNVRYISDDEVPIFFSASDICMLTYKSATQSGILSIALHYDLPVIATDTGGMKEVIEPYEIGEIISEADPNLISDSVVKFFDDGKDYYQKIMDYKKLASWESLAKTVVSLK